MANLRLPRSVYLRRAVTCYERQSDPRAAADLLAAHGGPTERAEAARRLVALGELAAAGDAYLAAGQPHAALDCFRRARQPEGELRCLQIIGDAAQTGMLLLRLHRPAEARPHLQQALEAARTPAVQAMLGLHLARALLHIGQVEEAHTHERAAAALLASLPATTTSAEAWAALGAWGQAVGRSDRMQEGYARALRLLESVGEMGRWREVARHYRDAARACGNRRLAHLLDMQLDEHPAPEAASPDPARALLDDGAWAAALAELEPRAVQGEEAALRLLAELPGNAAVPPDLRLSAAHTLGQAGDPRLLDIQVGDAPRAGFAPDAGYWCDIAGGPFWFGDDRSIAQPECPFCQVPVHPLQRFCDNCSADLRAVLTVREIQALQRVILPYDYRIARYPLTNSEYQRFIEAGGYTERRWWTVHGWNLREQAGWSAPAFYSELAQRPNQPVTGISWYEAAACCSWLTEQGHRAGWLPQGAELRMPTSLEWERAARHIDQRRYPWGSEEPDREHAGSHGEPVPVGCFPAGAAVCGALDMVNNVAECLASLQSERGAQVALRDTPEMQAILQVYAEDTPCCGSRTSAPPVDRYHRVGFRLVWVPVR